MARRSRKTAPDPISGPRGAGRGLALIAGLIVACILALHFLAPEPEVDTAPAPITTTR